MATSFLSWDTLGTFAGATAAVVLIVQFLKVPVEKLTKVSTRILVYVVSLILLLAAAFFTGKAFTIDSIALCVFNAFLVALSSMSLYEQAIAEPEAAKYTIAEAVGEDTETETDNNMQNDGSNG